MENIVLDHIQNLRDLSGSTDKIRQNRILRGPCLDRMSEQDIHVLRDICHLSTVIDLRTHKERSERPDHIIPGVRYLHMPIFEDRIPGITHEKGHNDPGHFDMAYFYRQTITGVFLDRVREVVRTIITLPEEGYAVLYHCTEGKDRTGIITAILMMIMGEDKKTIITDYLYTNHVNEPKAERYYQMVLEKTGDIRQAEGIRDAFMARERYIQAFFDGIDEDWGSTDTFLQEGLLLSEGELEYFRDKVCHEQ